MFDPGPARELVVRQRPPEPPERSGKAQARSRRRGVRIVQGVALLVFASLLILALFGSWIANFEPQAMALTDSLQPPSATHWFGTDQLGRDVFSRITDATRLTLLIAASVVLLAGGIGSLLGIAAGYSGGAVDAVVMRLADIQLALPAIIIAMVLSGAVGQSFGNLIVVLALASWARFARVIRSEALSLKTREFVLLVRLAGASRWWIMFRHIVPNIGSTFIVLATLDVGTVIVLEATLSFLGLGVQPPDISWGGLIAEGRGFLGNAWWVCIFPGAMLMVSVLSANFVGDMLRDWLNPVMPETW